MNENIEQSCAYFDCINTLKETVFNIMKDDSLSEQAQGYVIKKLREAQRALQDILI